MASLIENLIIELNEEYAIYENLLVVSQEKTSAIVSNNLDRLRETTDKEQFFVDSITSLDNKRRQTMNNIASVINKEPGKLRLIDVIEFLEGQDEFQLPLKEINDKLSKIAVKLKEVNSHNKTLIMEALDMIEYNINLMQNLNRAPETAEYSKDMFKGAGSYAGTPAMPQAGKFDTSQ